MIVTGTELLTVLHDSISEGLKIVVVVVVVVVGGDVVVVSASEEVL